MSTWLDSTFVDRRRFLSDFGRGAVGVGIFGLAGATWIGEAAAATTSKWRYARADLGFVNAYVLARKNEAVVIDTGVAGSGPAIAKTLKTLGLSWSNVRHLILTHNHGDHAGSVSQVLKSATKAQAYAGVLDVPGITSPRSVTGVKDGDTVFGLQVIDTPGHTAGSISILEPTLGLLLAGDALNESGGRATGPNPQYTTDLAQAKLSVAKLAEQSFETLLTGHGKPILQGAAASVQALAAAQ